MRLLITFSLVGVALGQGRFGRLRELFGGGRSGGSGGSGGGAGGLLSRFSGGGGGGLFGGGSCNCDEHPGPSGGRCFDQMQDVKECVKGVFQDELPSRSERRRMKAQVKALKEDILDNCFDSPCVDPREAVAEFGACMAPTVTGSRGRGIMDQFDDCMDREGAGREFRQNMKDKAQKMFSKLMKNGDDEDSEDDEGMGMGKGMMMMRNGGPGGMMEKKREMLEKLVGAVCPTRTSANRASQCIENRINRSGLNQGSNRRSPNPMAMLGKLNEAKPCSCRVSQDCKDDMKSGMRAVCACKDGVLTSRVRSQTQRQARRCARRAGINADGFGDMIEKVKSKMSKMCDGDMMEKMKKLSCE